MSVVRVTGVGVRSNIQPSLPHLAPRYRLLSFADTAAKPIALFRALQRTPPRRWTFGACAPFSFGRLTAHTTRTDLDVAADTYSYTPQKFETYREASISGCSTKHQTGSTTNSYDAGGFLVGLKDSTKSANSRSFVNYAAGRALQVNQPGNVERQLINGNYPTASPGSYTVRSGDSLRSIARGAWGDSQLWYRLAQANGSNSEREPRVGQTLTIPNLPAARGCGRSLWRWWLWW